MTPSVRFDVTPQPAGPRPPQGDRQSPATFDAALSGAEQTRGGPDRPPASNAEPAADAVGRPASRGTTRSVEARTRTRVTPRAAGEPGSSASGPAKALEGEESEKREKPEKPENPDPAKPEAAADPMQRAAPPEGAVRAPMPVDPNVQAHALQALTGPFVPVVVSDESPAEPADAGAAEGVETAATGPDGQAGLLAREPSSADGRVSKGPVESSRVDGQEATEPAARPDSDAAKASRLARGAAAVAGPGLDDGGIRPGRSGEERDVSHAARSAGDQVPASIQVVPTDTQSQVLAPADAEKEGQQATAASSQGPASIDRAVSSLEQAMSAAAGEARAASYAAGKRPPMTGRRLLSWPDAGEARGIQARDGEPIAAGSTGFATSDARPAEGQVPRVASPTVAALRAFGIQFSQRGDRPETAAEPAGTRPFDSAPNPVALGAGAVAAERHADADPLSLPGRSAAHSAKAPAVGVTAVNPPAPAEASTTAAVAVDSAQPTRGASEVDPPIGSQIVKGVSLAWRDGVGEAKIRLTPEHLGEVVVALKVERGQVVAQFRTESATAQTWIESHQQDLRQALAGQGLQLDRLVVTADGQRQHARDESGARQRQPSPRGRQAADAPRFEVRA